MVLAELGGKLRESIRKLQLASSSTAASSSSDPYTITKNDVDTLLSDISRALIESDVNIKLVFQLRENIKRKVDPLLAEMVSATAAASGDNSSDTTTAMTTGMKRHRATNHNQQSANNQRILRLVHRAVVDELVALLQPPSPQAASSSKSEGAGGNNDDVTTLSKKKPSSNNKSKNKNHGRGSNTAFSNRNHPMNIIRKGTCNIIVMVGLQGAGKTTTIGKLAHYYIKKQYKVGLICADTFRAGAFDQLKQNATKLRIPFYGSYQNVNPITIAQQGIQQFQKDGYEIILIDTSGRHKQESTLFVEMSNLITTVQPHLTILVVDATQGQSLYDQALAFHTSVPVGCVIVTKLDGHAKGGGALSAVAATQSPIVFTGTGEHFDDLEIFDPESFVHQLLGYGNIRGLMDAMNNYSEEDEETKNAIMMEKLAKGEYTLRDMYKDVEKILNIGSWNKLTSMIPGMSDFAGGAGQALSPGQEEEQTYRLRRFMIIMDSMTNGELDGKFKFQNYVHDTDPIVVSRLQRIARGAGCHVNEVKMTLQAHAQFATMFGKYGKLAATANAMNTGAGGPFGSGMGAAQQQQLMQRMKKNPEGTMNQLLNNMDPAMIQSMGGRQQIMAMMEQMANGGGNAVPRPGAGYVMDPLAMASSGGGIGGAGLANMMQNMIMK